MRKIFLCILCLWFPFFLVKAHPLDISSSFLSFQKKYVSVTSFFHTYEIEYLFSQKQIPIKSIYEYFHHQEIIKQYIKDHIKIIDGENTCFIENIDIGEQEEYNILSKGFEVNYRFLCEKDISSGKILVDFFTEFPLQTNQVTIYDLNSKTTANIPKSHFVFTSQVKEYLFDLGEQFSECKKDTDGDGLSDEEEMIYKTDPYNIDSDNDFYTDYEEIYNSWFPLDSFLGPNQDSRREIPSDVMQMIESNKKRYQECQKIQKTHSDSVVQGSLYTNNLGGEYFTEILKKIGDYITGKQKENIVLLLLGVVFLGFIHALGPGHSKSLLISYMLDKSRSFFDGFLYVIIFTLTHLIDIILLFLFTKIIFQLYDVSVYMHHIQKISLIILFCLSIYMMRSFFAKKRCRMENKPNTNIKTTLFIGFLAGLAPCTFGWSIFLLLFSLGNFSLMLPMLLSLGIGIFICLFLIMCITFIMRKKVFEKFFIFSEYSRLVSAFLLFMISILLLMSLGL